ncbi:MAG: polysaccharide biosynthesis tyrosine autokinase, partial [Actinobacteria bacterium]|nr:polysaccharide biosynthesis tyrosine autokinase [Actinomycetota bacterium]
GLAAQRASLRGSEVFARGGGQIIQPAEIPEEPFAPRPLRTGVLAVVLGLMLGVGLAFLRDFMDDAVRSDEQARRATGQPVLGHIPRWKEASAQESRLVTLVQPASPVSEAYKTLRTNVRFMTAGRASRSVLVTSPLAGEGKTTTAANLAVALARTQTRVLLVGSDLRKPTIHRLFGIESRPGLSEVLIGDVEIADVVTDVGVPNLRVIPGGTVPPNPAELLSSAAMHSLMTDLEHIADMVIYDGPPVMPVADALEIGPRVGATILVIDTGTTGRHALRAATQRLEDVGVNLTGVILNRIDPDDAYYGYDYYAAYMADGAETEPPPSRPTRRWGPTDDDMAVE